MTKTASYIIIFAVLLAVIAIPLFFLGYDNTAQAETYYYQTDNNYSLYAQANALEDIIYTTPSTNTYTKSVNFSLILGHSQNGYLGIKVHTIEKRTAGSGNDERIYIWAYGYYIINGQVTQTSTSSSIITVYLTQNSSNENYKRVQLVQSPIIFDTINDMTSFFNDQLLSKYFIQIPYQYVDDSTGGSFDFNEFWDDYVYEPLKYWYETAIYNYNDKYDTNYSYPPESWEDYNVCQTALAELCGDMEIEITALEQDNERLATAYAPYAAMDFVTGIFNSLGSLLNITIGPIPLYAFIAIPLVLGIIYLIFRLLR